MWPSALASASRTGTDLFAARPPGPGHGPAGGQAGPGQELGHHHHVRPAAAPAVQPRAADRVALCGQDRQHWYAPWACWCAGRGGRPDAGTFPLGRSALVQACCWSSGPRSARCSTQWSRRSKTRSASDTQRASPSPPLYRFPPFVCHACPACSVWRMRPAQTSGQLASSSRTFARVTSAAEWGGLGGDAMARVYP